MVFRNEVGNFGDWLFLLLEDVLVVLLESKW